MRTRIATYQSAVFIIVEETIKSESFDFADDSSHTKDHYLSDSSSSMTNEGESIFDTSPEYPPIHSHLVAKDKLNPSRDSANVQGNPSETHLPPSEVNTLMVAEHQNTPPPSDPPIEDDELEILKQQGAIPKNYRRSQNMPSEIDPSSLHNQGNVLITPHLENSTCTQYTFHAFTLDFQTLILSGLKG